MLSIFGEAKQHLQQLGKLCGTSNRVIESLSHPNSTLCVSLPVLLDDGSTQYFEAFRCQYSTLLGPCKGLAGCCNDIEKLQNSELSHHPITLATKRTVLN
jgi:glutamate dehydrogenase/leucine dehydrogenase